MTNKLHLSTYPQLALWISVENIKNLSFFFTFVENLQVSHKYYTQDVNKKKLLIALFIKALATSIKEIHISTDYTNSNNKLN